MTTAPPTIDIRSDASTGDCGDLQVPPVQGDGGPTPWLEGLNPDQLGAVQHRGGPLLVAAGAGSGKTRTLACRVASLIDEGIAPERILLLTFTRRAAREMIDRARSLTGETSAGRVVGGTFHAVANRLLRQHGSALGLPPGFSILDQGDAGDLIGIVRTDLGHGDGDRKAGGRRFPKKETLVSIYSRTVNAGEPLPHVLDTAFPWCREHREAIGDIFRAYTERKRRLAVLDFDDLLLYWRALAQHPTAGPVLRDMFDHVLVDEYQDTNTIQADVLWAMLGDAPDLTVVGDDAQSIYSFRAASVRNILDFPTRYPTARVIKLERNYRSTPSILAASNAVIEQAREGYGKVLWTEKPDGPLPRLVTCTDETEQARYVVERVLEARERGILLRDQCVLFRTGHHADGLELELQRRDVPYVKFGGLKFLEAAHVKDLLSLLRVLDNPYDELAWSRSLQLLEGVGPATVRKVCEALGVTRGPTDDARDPLTRFLDGEVDLPAHAEEVAALVTAWTAVATGAGEDEVPVATQIDTLRGVCERTFPRRYRDVTPRLADLDHLAELAGELRTRARFLADVTLDPPASTSDLAQPPRLDDDYLILSTVHSAKGGEWSRVHVIHAADGNIPSDMALGSAEEVEEERRLLYVAMTRAEDELDVSYPLRFYHRRHGSDDAHTYAQLSRFLSPVMDRFASIALSTGEVEGGPTQHAVAADPVAGYLADLW